MSVTEASSLSTGSDDDEAIPDNGQLSPIVSELLAIMGLDSGEEYTPPQKPADPVLQNNLDDDRLHLKTAYRDSYSKDPGGLTKEQSKELGDLRWQFTNLLPDAVKSQDNFDSLNLAFKKLANKHHAIAIKATKAEATRQRLLEAFKALGPFYEAIKQLGEAKLLQPDIKDVKARLDAPKEGEFGRALEEIEPQAQRIMDLHATMASLIEREKTRKELQQQLELVIASAAKQPDDIVKGANDQDVKPLFETRDNIAKGLAEPAPTPEEFQKLAQEIGGLDGSIAVLSDIVEKRQQRHDYMAAELAKYRDEFSRISGVDPDAIMGSAGEIEKALGVSPVTDDALDLAAKEMPSLVSNFNDAKRDAAERVATANELKTQVTFLLDQIKEYGDVFGNTKNIQEALEEDLSLLEDTENLYNEDLENLAGRIPDHRKDLDTAGQKTASKMKDEDQLQAAAEYLKTVVENSESKAKEVANFLDDPSIEEKVQGFITKINSLISKPNQNSLTQAFKAVFDIWAIIDQAKEDPQFEWVAAQRRLLLQAVGIEDPHPLPGIYKEMLQGERDEVETALDLEKNTVTADVIGETRPLAAAFEQDFQIAQDISKIWDEKTFKTAMDKARQPLKVELGKAMGLALAAETMSEGLVHCTTVDRLAKQAIADAQKADKAKGDIGANEIGKTLDPSIVDDIYDVMGPDAVADLDAKAMATLCSCFSGSPNDRSALRSLVTEGLGAQAKALGALLRRGDKDAVLELARSYDGKDAAEDRAQLRSLVVNGGIGEAPNVLADLVGYGTAGQPGNKAEILKGNVNRLKGVGTAFGGDDGAARMNTLVSDCGLGQARTEDPPRPGIFAELLNGGFAGDPAQLRGFADAFAGEGAEGATDRERLKGLVQEGGFGAHPKAFVPLVKSLSTGGVEGGAKKLKEIGTEFRTKANREKLGRLLASGGLSGDVVAPDGTPEANHPHEYPDTLAKVFTDGFDQDPVKLRKFVGAFGDSDNHARQCKDMMLAWNEYGENAPQRQPGRQIKRLLVPGKLGINGVEELQKSFTHSLNGINDADKRKVATRFAPHFDKKYVGKTWISQANGGPGMQNAGVDAVEGYVLKRHAPQYFDKAKMGAYTKHSQFPPGADVAALVDDALMQLGPNPQNLPPQDHILNVGNPPLLVQIAFRVDGAGQLLVVHFTPWKGAVHPLVESPAPPDPNETGDFETADINAILSATKQ